MNMRDAFKRLLDGKRITRTNWDKDVYIEYEERYNKFILHFKYGIIGISEKPYFGNDSIDGDYIIFYDFKDKEFKMEIFNDDKNKIYEEEISEKELKSMKWELMSICLNSLSCDKCKIKEKYPKDFNCHGYTMCFIKDLHNIKKEEIKGMYKHIKQEMN